MFVSIGYPSWSLGLRTKAKESAGTATLAFNILYIKISLWSDFVLEEVTTAACLAGKRVYAASMQCVQWIACRPILSRSLSELAVRRFRITEVYSIGLRSGANQ